ncbi:hypothetical protein GCM10010345_41860 [Streptomyces canarius]|uniref:Uncharacterized protein n=1 Tax=Streptomyces canarius TaxID=285453 RepID=A0ABQ3CP98_9ACTN|nr:hypothetical protein GCM10010345_41860 [Streptomyces canarius]
MVCPRLEHLAVVRTLLTEGALHPGREPESTLPVVGTHTSPSSFRPEDSTGHAVTSLNYRAGPTNS